MRWIRVLFLVRTALRRLTVQINRVTFGDPEENRRYERENGCRPWDW